MNLLRSAFLVLVSVEMEIAAASALSQCLASLKMESRADIYKVDLIISAENAAELRISQLCADFVPEAGLDVVLEIFFVIGNPFHRPAVAF